MASDSRTSHSVDGPEGVSTARRRLAARLVAPWWYRVGAALCTAGLFVGPALLSFEGLVDESVAHLAVVLLAVVGPLLLLWALQRATGVRIDRYAEGLGAWYAVVFTTWLLGLGAQILWGTPYVLLAGAGVAFVATLLAERRVDRLLAQRVGAGRPAA